MSSPGGPSQAELVAALGEPVGWPPPDELPAGKRFEWRAAQWWRAPARPGYGCRYTVGPGHRACSRPGIAEYQRGTQWWAYCDVHLHWFGKRLHDDVVYEAVVVEVPS